MDLEVLYKVNLTIDVLPDVREKNQDRYREQELSSEKQGLVKALIQDINARRNEPIVQWRDVITEAADEEKVIQKPFGSEQISAKSDEGA